MTTRRQRACATADCGRIPQRGRPYCWLCDPAVPEEQKRTARAARWRGRLIAPDFGTLGSRVRYREALAEATMEGEVIPPVAAIGLKAVNDAGDDLSRDKTGVLPGAFTIMIERFGSPVAALPASNTPDADAAAAASPPPLAPPLITVEQFADSS
jgi:hypothetical protein